MFDWKRFDWIKLPFSEFDTLEENGKRQYVIDGKPLPSMTTILSILDDGGIDEWAKRVGEKEAEKIVREAVLRGNSLHDLSERYLMNTLERGDVQGPGAVLFNRNRVHLNTLGPIVGIEVCLFSKERGYAGRADCIAFQGKDLCIVDHKNSRNPIDLKKDYGRKKLFKYTIQATGYAVAFKEMFPSLPMPKYGCLIVGNYRTMNSSVYKFEIAPLIKELDIILEGYYSKGDVKRSAYYRL